MILSPVAGSKSLASIRGSLRNAKSQMDKECWFLRRASGSRSSELSDGGGHPGHAGAGPGRVGRKGVDGLLLCQGCLALVVSTSARSPDPGRERCVLAAQRG